jgi:hypothetical protein
MTSAAGPRAQGCGALVARISFVVVIPDSISIEREDVQVDLADADEAPATAAAMPATARSKIGLYLHDSSSC